VTAERRKGSDHAASAHGLASVPDESATRRCHFRQVPPRGIANTLEVRGNAFRCSRFSSLLAVLRPTETGDGHANIDRSDCRAGAGRIERRAGAMGLCRGPGTAAGGRRTTPSGSRRCTSPRVCRARARHGRGPSHGKTVHDRTERVSVVLDAIAATHAAASPDDDVSPCAGDYRLISACSAGGSWSGPCTLEARQEFKHGMSEHAMSGHAIERQLFFTGSTLPWLRLDRRCQSPRQMMRKSRRVASDMRRRFVSPRTGHRHSHKV
jgi:hypothetical protein